MIPEFHIFYAKKCPFQRSFFRVSFFEIEGLVLLICQSFRRIHFRNVLSVPGVRSIRKNRPACEQDCCVRLVHTVHSAVHAAFVQSRKMRKIVRGLRHRGLFRKIVSIFRYRSQH